MHHRNGGGEGQGDSRAEGSKPDLGRSPKVMRRRWWQKMAPQRARTQHQRAQKKVAKTLRRPVDDPEAWRPGTRVNITTSVKRLVPPARMELGLPVVRSNIGALVTRIGFWGPLY